MSSHSSSSTESLSMQIPNQGNQMAITGTDESDLASNSSALSQASVSSQDVEPQAIEPVEEPFPLLQLPPELIDLVVEHAMDLELEFHNGSLFGTAGHIMASPISRLCRMLRGRVIDILKTKCVWIRLYCSVPKIQESILKLCHIPIVPARHRALLTSDTPTIDLLVGSSVVTAVTEQALESPQQSILFPFSHQTWLALIQSIQCIVNRVVLARADTQNPSVGHVALRCGKRSASIDLVLESKILPAFLALRDLTKVGIIGQPLSSALVGNDANRLGRLYMELKTARTIYCEYKDMENIHDRMIDLEASDCPSEESEVACYSYERLKMALSRLRHPCLYNLPFEDHDHLLHHAVARYCLEIVEPACRELRYKYEINGPKWFRHSLLDVQWWCPTFMRALHLSAFSLRMRERALLHKLFADLYKMRARVGAGLEPNDTDEKVPAHVREQYDVFIREVGRQEYISARLKELVKGKKTEESMFRNVSGMDYIEVHNVKGTGLYWAGCTRMVQSWAGPNSLQYLPLARQNAVYFLPEGGEYQPGANSYCHNEPKDRHCGQPCNCVIF